MTEKRLSEQLDENNRLLRAMLSKEKLPGEKKVRIPKLGKGKVKKGYVLVMLLKKNHYLEIRKLKVVDDNVYLKDNETYHMTGRENIVMYKKDPVILLPEDSIEPITIEMLNRKIDENKSTVKPQKQIIHLMENAKLAEQNKPKRSMKGIIVVGLILVGGYMLGKQFGWW